MIKIIMKPLYLFFLDLFRPSPFFHLHSYSSSPSPTFSLIICFFCGGGEGGHIFCWRADDFQAQ